MKTEKATNRARGEGGEGGECWFLGNLLKLGIQPTRGEMEEIPKEKKKTTRGPIRPPGPGSGNETNRRTDKWDSPTRLAGQLDPCKFRCIRPDRYYHNG